MDNKVRDIIAVSTNMSNINIDASLNYLMALQAFIGGRFLDYYPEDTSRSHLISGVSIIVWSIHVRRIDSTEDFTDGTSIQACYRYLTVIIVKLGITVKRIRCEVWESVDQLKTAIIEYITSYKPGRFLKWTKNSSSTHYRLGEGTRTKITRICIDVL